MASYRSKTEADLAWNRLRREVEYRINLAAAHYKDKAKNELLPKLQEDFEAALIEGKILAFEDVSLSAEDWLGSLGKELNAAK